MNAFKSYPHKGHFFDLKKAFSSFCRLCYYQHCQVEPLCAFLVSAPVPRLIFLLHKLGTETMVSAPGAGPVLLFSPRLCLVPQTHARKNK